MPIKFGHIGHLGLDVYICIDTPPKGLGAQHIFRLGF
jgi:hypothetical protein